jgi:3-hydroxyacyl-[acyl-carrier-protein] dehydratase
MRFEHFKLIDRIVALDIEARSVRSLGRVPRESTSCEHHFPSFPLMPGVLQIECMAQTIGWLAMAVSGFAAMPFLAEVKEAKFRTAVMPGDELEFEGRLVHEGSGFAVGECKGRRQGKSICEAQILYRVASFPSAKFRSAVLQRAEEIGLPVKEFSK